MNITKIELNILITDKEKKIKGHYPQKKVCDLLVRIFYQQYEELIAKCATPRFSGPFCHNLEFVLSALCDIVVHIIQRLYVNHLFTGHFKAKLLLYNNYNINKIKTLNPQILN